MEHDWRGLLQGFGLLRQGQAEVLGLGEPSRVGSADEFPPCLHDLPLEEGA